MNKQINLLHDQIIQTLKNKNSTYSRPVSSHELSAHLQVNPSYLRNQITVLVQEGRVAVRRGAGGGYYLTGNENGRKGSIMRLIIDGMIQELDPLTFTRDVFEDVQDFIGQQGKTIQDIWVDGIQIDDFSQISDLAKFEIVEIQTILKQELFFEAVREGYQYLPKLAEGILQVSELFQEGNEGEAVKLFIDALEGFSWLNAVLANIEVIMHRETIYHQLFDLRGEYENQLSQLLDAWEKNDFVMIADLLEYELNPIITRFLSITTGLPEEVA